MSGGASNDFSHGSMASNIFRQAIPLIIAQLVQLLYNVVDRIYIGHLEGVGTDALTGVGLTFPIVSFILAFSRLISMGGAPLCSIARGAGDTDKAERIMANSLTLLLISAAALTAVGYAFSEPMLYLFGASGNTFGYAYDYLNIYMSGTVFAVVSDGMNSFINSQGYPKTAMATTVIGAVVNLALDPIFIFALDMGVKGAALATVISQAISAFWVMRFILRRGNVLRLDPSKMRLRRNIVMQISALGVSGFVMSGTNSVVQVVCNSTLKIYGGDIYVAVMTVISSVREILSLPVTGITSAAQPVLGYNYGAGRNDRVCEGIRIISLIGMVYTGLAWAAVLLFPQVFIGMFSDDPQMLAYGVSSLHIYFFGFIFMSLQFAGQSTFVALGKSGRATFFSLLRKAVIVVPLTLLLPKIPMLGVNGVFAAEPISNVIGGAACFITMYFTVYKRMDKGAADKIISP